MQGEQPKDDFHEHLRGLVLRCVPADARVIWVPRQFDTVFAISWPLLSGSQPTKRSRVIRLTIAADFVRAYGEASTSMRRDADARLSIEFSEQLEDFDADHGEHHYADPPTVAWTIGAGGPASHCESSRSSQPV